MTALTAEGFFRAAGDLPICSVAEVAGDGGLLVLAPHPDDETLGCGALVAAARSEGRPVSVVFVSDGAGSHPGSRSHPPAALRSLRQQEARRAAADLAVEPDALHFLDLPDRFVPDRGPAFEAAALRVTGIAEAAGTTALLATWRHDPHCDHQATWALALEAARRMPGLLLWAYPVWGWTLPADYPVCMAPDGCRFPAAPHLAQKRRALQAYRSQLADLIADDPAGFSLPPALRELVERPFEIYLRP